MPAGWKWQWCNRVVVQKYICRKLVYWWDGCYCKTINLSGLGLLYSFILKLNKTIYQRPEKMGTDAQWCLYSLLYLFSFIHIPLYKKQNNPPVKTASFNVVRKEGGCYLDILQADSEFKSCTPCQQNCHHEPSEIPSFPTLFFANPTQHFPSKAPE